MPRAAGGQLLQHHVPEAVAASKAVGHVPSSRQLNLAVGLPLRNQKELEGFLKELVDPASPGFRHYLTPEQFAERFGPTEEDYQALADFFRANGLSITATHPNRTILDITGTVAQIERTLHVNMMYWSHPVRGTFFAPDRDPSIDAGVAILDISGLDNFVVPRPMDLKSRPLNEAVPLTTGSGPGGLFIGNDFRAAYAPVTLNGAGQTIGLFELDGFYASDVQANFQKSGVTPVPVQTVLLDGFNGAPGSGNIEVTLDIMMAAYVAPGVSKIIVYEGTNPDDVLNRMATDNLASQLSSSWGWSPLDAIVDQIFKQMIAQGQSMFQASGDDGAYHGAVMPPSDDPNITVVGGTSLTTYGPGGAWQSETAWSDSGGGVSTTWPIPSYQQSVNMAAADGSSTMRNIPDVALIADIQIFLICNDGQSISVGGTSAATPLWAGFVALANQQAAANKKPAVGFLNPTIYSIGEGSNYSSDLHDITSGNNGFPALPGYDLATGWGTPFGQALINSLTATSNAPGFSLSSSATSLSVAPGANGTSTITVNPQQGFSGTVSLAISGLPAGVTASFSPASAVTTSTLTVVASSSASASTSTLTITGTSGSSTSTARISLTITAPPSFSLSATPSSLNLARGGVITSTIAVNAQGGFQGSVSFAASGLPGSVTASFSPSASAQSSTLTLTATSSATIGNSTITITGTSGSLHSSTTINLTVASISGSFTIAASPANVSLQPGGSGATTISVSPQSGFNGTVSFSIAGLPTGVTFTFNPPLATGTTTLTLYAAANTTPGTATVTVTGSSGAVTSKTTIAVTVTAPPNFTLVATPASLSIAAGASGASTIAVNAQNGFNSAVALAASGLPSGVTANFAPASATRTGVVTFTATSTAATGTATVTITGTSGALSSKVAIALTISKPPSFTLLASPTALTIAQGATGMSTLTLTPQNGFSSPVLISVSGLPNGVIPSFTAGTTPNTGILTFAVSATAAPGTSTITVTGKAGSLSQSVPIALTVQALSTAGGSVSLASAYNVMGVVTDGAQFLSTSGLDGGGRAYSANLLGTVRTAGGASYNFGPSNALGAVTGGTIALPSGTYSTLTLLATAVNGNQIAQKFIITYTDGSTSTFTQSLSDWCTPQNYAGESNAISMPYRDNSNGTRDTRTVMLYSYTFALNIAKTVKSITLPSNRNAVVLAMDLNAASSSPSAHALDSWILNPGR